jgi:sulfate transport system substrate-binding protein
LLAAYQSQILQKKSAKAANTYLNSLVSNVVSEPTSGSKALTAFLAGTGNVLLAYEADAQQAIDNGSTIEIVQPTENLLIENPAALTTTGSSNPAAVAFYKYLFSPVGQSIWETYNFRPASPALKDSVLTDFYQPVKLTTITKLGGWPAVITKYFGTSGIITQVENAHGYTT